MKQSDKKVAPEFKKLGDMLLIKRGGRGIRAVAEEIKISAATLSRIERGYTADIETLKKVCDWLEVDISTVLGGESSFTPQKSTTPTAMVHFRKDHSIAPKTAKALADLILAAQEKMVAQQ